jgi:hypothetical protein
MKRKLAGVLRSGALLLVCFLFYLACAGTLSRAEAVLGLAVAALAASLPARRGAYRSAGAADWRFASVLAWRLARGTMRECRIVLWGVVSSALRGRALAGTFLRVPMEPGGHGGGDRRRRAVVLWGMSVSPNDYAVRIEPGSRTLLTHRLFPDARPPGRGELRWPL